MSRAVHKLILSPSQNAVFSSPKRWFAAKSKKGGKGGGAAATKAGPNLSREEISKTVVAANINKEGSDPAIKPDSEYPDWLWRLVEKEPPLSVLQRKDPSTMSFYELSRFVKLENRRRIKEKNSLRAKN